MIWDNDMSIDSYQSDMNQQEEIFGLKELEERMVMIVLFPMICS